MKRQLALAFTVFALGMCISATAMSAGLDYARGNPGVKAKGMGSAYTAVADDPSAVYWNPAGLFEALASGISVEYNNLDQVSDNPGQANDDGRVLYLNGIYSGRRFAWGASLRSLEISKLDFSDTDLTVAAGYKYVREGSPVFFPRFSAGLNGTIYGSSRSGRDYSGFGYALGILFPVFENTMAGAEEPVPDWSVKLGAAYRPEVELEGDRNDLPARSENWVVGMSVAKTLPNLNRITLASDYQQLDAPRTINITRVGLDYLVLLEGNFLTQVSVRAGGQFATRYDSYSGGVGLGFGDHINLEISYESFKYENVEDKGNVYSVAARYIF